LQLQSAGDVVLRGARELVTVLSDRAREHVDTICVGRTHGVHYAHYAEEIVGRLDGDG